MTRFPVTSDLSNLGQPAPIAPEEAPTTQADLPQAQDVPRGQQRLIRRVLTPALRWWLQTQVEAVTELEIDLQAKDQQVLAGYLPLVRVLAVGVIFQGLCLTQARLQAENIRVNLGQVLRGKPLKLLEPIQAWGELHLTSADFQQSLDSDLMRSALRDLICILSKELNQPLPTALATLQVAEATVNFGHGALDCTLNLLGEQPFTISFASEIGLASPQCLEFRQLRAFGLEPQTIQINLGEDVHLESLCLTPEKLTCEGGLTVFP
ncbi:DUF2993 domain-containing protein [Synechococcus sp. PCC 6312]|uniref:LmeA family phospholipid-binding protein n=1 Tax=Synechococcus sp. (strain ATCC 27167 / PCC 6312) TaxID=195253 RepID=UPI00029F40CB|nr:DUF2993 domain-containing protein [Synechococcus sp. PCC 6312]AFY61473.1 Protein of unknown function (DUF2993) [Synechococcus sp. PCC 6312]